MWSFRHDSGRLDGFMGTAAIALLLYTRGSVDALIVMYSINVFVTFSLSQLGMSRFFIQRRLQWDGLTTVILPIRVRS
jgi:hypothetical protein